MGGSEGGRWPVAVRSAGLVQAKAAVPARLRCGASLCSCQVPNRLNLPRRVTNITRQQFPSANKLNPRMILLSSHFYFEFIQIYIVLPCVRHWAKCSRFRDKLNNAFHQETHHLVEWWSTKETMKMLCVGGVHRKQTPQLGDGCVPRWLAGVTDTWVEPQRIIRINWTRKGTGNFS